METVVNPIEIKRVMRDMSWIVTQAGVFLDGALLLTENGFITNRATSAHFETMEIAFRLHREYIAAVAKARAEEAPKVELPAPWEWRKEEIGDWHARDKNTGATENISATEANACVLESLALAFRARNQPPTCDGCVHHYPKNTDWTCELERVPETCGAKLVPPKQDAEPARTWTFDEAKYKMGRGDIWEYHMTDAETCPWQPARIAFGVSEFLSPASNRWLRDTYSDNWSKYIWRPKPAAELTVIERYQKCTSKLFDLFESDPLGNHPAHFYIQRLEALIGLNLLRPVQPAGEAKLPEGYSIQVSCWDESLTLCRQVDGLTWADAQCHNDTECTALEALVAAYKSSG
jgi:hypothetical protein